MAFLGIYISGFEGIEDIPALWVNVLLNILEMSLESAVRCIEAALSSNPHCTAGLFTQNRVFAIPENSANGAEVLALLYADDSFFGYWYGHIIRHPENPALFVSLIVWSEKLVNAQNVPLLFKRYRYWIIDCLEYDECAVQDADDAYQESCSIEMAARNLAEMIARFDLDKRTGNEFGLYADSPPELRILQIYRMKDVIDKNGFYPRFPMPTSLSIVKS
jgi:hypothetical protein